MPLSDLGLMAARLPALFVHDDRGRIVRVNAADGGPAPRFFLGRTAAGCVWRFGALVDDELAASLAALCDDEPLSVAMPREPSGAASYVALLGRVAPVERQWVGPAYRFPAGLPVAADVVRLDPSDVSALEPDFIDWTGDVARCQPFMALVADGRAVSLCASVRAGDEVHEAGVETLAEYRGRGYGARVTSAWAAEVRPHRRGAGVQHVVAEPLVAGGGEEAGSDPLRHRLSSEMSAVAHSSGACAC